MAKLSYLTVPDFLWINQELTRKRQKYSFATLEEAVFSQYGHGSSTDLTGQAARLFKDFPRLHPFESGNEACAFVGLLAFLHINEKDLDLSPEEALAWARQTWKNPEGVKEAIEARLVEGHLHPSKNQTPTRAAVAVIRAKFGAALQGLVLDEPAIPLAAK
jgi:death-on-curing protein